MANTDTSLSSSVPALRSPPKSQPLPQPPISRVHTSRPLTHSFSAISFVLLMSPHHSPHLMSSRTASPCSPPLNCTMCRPLPTLLYCHIESPVNTLLLNSFIILQSLYYLDSLQYLLLGFFYYFLKFVVPCSDEITCLSPSFYLTGYLICLLSYHNLFP